MTRRHSPETVARIVALRAAGKLHSEIAAELGIPRVSITTILRRRPVAQVATAETQRSMSEVVKATLDKALARLNAALDDPKTRTGEVAQSVRILSDNLRLLQGESTSNVALAVRGGVGDGSLTVLPDGITDDERRYLRDAIDRALERRRRWQQGIPDDPDEMAVDKLEEILTGRLAEGHRVPMILNLVGQLTPAEEAELAAALGEGTLALTAGDTDVPD